MCSSLFDAYRGLKAVLCKNVGYDWYGTDGHVHVSVSLLTTIFQVTIDDWIVKLLWVTWKRSEYLRDYILNHLNYYEGLGKAKQISQ